MNKFDYKNLTPFKWFVLENFPFIEADFDALTEWQLFCKLGKEINKIIDSQNIVGEQAENLTNAFNNLKNYVDNYFENLDVQDEINNKLNEMAESGELEELISHYLQLAGLLCFNTINDMKNATNLIDGSFVKTFGKNTYNDGEGQFYKIREILNTDVVDNVNIIPLTNHNNLIAELIPNSHIESLQTQINNINNNVLTDMVVIGDSYTAFSTSTWSEDLAQQLHLTLHKHATSSMGYAHAINGKTFVDLLDWSDTSFYNKVKYVICYGGINDYDKTWSEIESAAKAFIIKAKSNFPNAQILLVGPQSSAAEYKAEKSVRQRTGINRACLRNGVAYYDAQDWLINTSFPYTDTYAADRLHPSALGNKIITSKMLGIINNQPDNEIDFKVSLRSGYNGIVINAKNKGFLHFEAKITNAQILGGQYNHILKIEGPDGLDNFTNFEAFASKRAYFPAYEYDSNNNVTRFLGCGRIYNTSAEPNKYIITLVPIVQGNFTGNIAISGDIYMNYVEINTKN